MGWQRIPGPAHGGFAAMGYTGPDVVCDEDTQTLYAATHEGTYTLPAQGDPGDEWQPPESTP